MVLRFDPKRVYAQQVVDEVATAKSVKRSLLPEHNTGQPPNGPERTERGSAHHGTSALKRGAWAAGALITVAMALTAGYAAAFHDRVQPGVHALGMDLGGLRPAEAQARLTARLDALARTQPVLRVDGRDVTLPPGAFGAPDALAAQVSRAAVQAGRAAPLGGLTFAVHAVGQGGASVDAPIADPVTLRAAVAALAPEVDRPAVEPQVLVDRGAPQAPLRVQPGQAGRRLDVDQTAADLAAAFASGVADTTGTTNGSAGGSRRAVEASFVAVPPAMDDARLEAAKDQAVALLVRPVAVVAGSKSLALPPAARLLERVDLGSGATIAGLRLTLDEDAFGEFATQVAQAAARPAQDARLVLRGEQIALVPSSDGAAVDPTALHDAVVAGWLAGAAQIEAPLQPVPARVTTDALQPLAAEANGLIDEPLVVTQGDHQWTLGRAALAKLLALPDDATPATLKLDDDRLQGTLQAMAAESARPATNARLDVQDGQVVAVPGEDGEAMDVAATAAAIQAALYAHGADRTVAALTRPVAPAFSVAQIEAARAQAVRIVGAPLTVRYGARAWTLSPADLAGMLLFGDSPGGAIPYLSRNQLLAWTQPIADEVNPQLAQEYTAARQAWEARRQGAAGQPGSAAPDGGQATKPDEPAPQRQWVDVPATAAAIWAQATQTTRVADVRLTADDPASPGALAAQGAAAQAGQPPVAIAARGKWIDVNLTAQTLVAYEGDWPILTTLVSTGLAIHPTPPGTYKIFSKLVADDMKGGSYATGDYYFLPKVPYVMYFIEGGYALHGTYWHHNFGHPMSHGCVNLPTDQSKLLFDWAPMGTTVVVHV